MNRREALNRVALILGTTVVGGTAFLEGCNTGDKKAAAAAGLPFSAENISFLDEVAETIIPATNTPGAKAAKVGAFMNTMVVDCYDEKNQKIFTEGLGKIEEASQKKFRENQKFPFPLLADHEKKIVEAFGVKNVIGVQFRVDGTMADGAGMAKLSGAEFHMAYNLPAMRAMLSRIFSRWGPILGASHTRVRSR